LRRVTAVDLMLLGTILLWALNVTVTKYVLGHGFGPLAYATTRYFAATALFWGFTYARERTFRIRRADVKLVVLAALFIFANQLTFVYGVHGTSAATASLLIGTIPVFIGLISTALGLERLQRSFWVGLAISFVGIGFVSAGSGGFSGYLLGDLLAVLTAVSWAAYSVTIAPLMRRYSPFRISALVLALGWLPLAITGGVQTAGQSFHFGTLMWLAFAYAIVGPLFLTNILWFTTIDRVGPARAALFVNLQPVFGVLFALALLGERLNRWVIVGGVAIAAGIVLERSLRTPPEPPGD
jgi:drug/metabolite transporter (DMT)-like permease